MPVRSSWPNRIIHADESGRSPYTDESVRSPVLVLVLRTFLDLGYLVCCRTPCLAVDSTRRLGARGLHQAEDLAGLLLDPASATPELRTK